MNPFRQLMMSSGGHTSLGTWIMSASALVAEAVGHAGFDWGVIDMEHSPLDMCDVVRMLQAVGNTKMVPVLRVPSNDAVTVKRVLDAGATTVLFPFVQSATDAAAAVAATRYPPQGVRGMDGMSRASRFGTDADYLQTANQRVGVIVQLESVAAVQALEAIAAVPGIDAIFIGPADLSADMGHPGQPMHPQVFDLMERAARRCVALGKPVGTVGGTPRDVTQYRAAGFSFVALGSDLGLLMQGAHSALQAMHRQSASVEVHTLAEGTRTGSGY
jgi:2-keto-3-deoxy-L-rhamnonate aldolase RhmA